jgi:ribosome biogenesis protein UTP30
MSWCSTLNISANEIPEQTLKASQALLRHIKDLAQKTAAEAPKKNLFSDEDADGDSTLAEEPVWVTVTTKRHIAKSHSLKPAKITVPHPLHTDPATKICLITAAPQGHYKDIVASPEFPEALRGRISKVVDNKKLWAKWRQFEAQRKLFSEHDIFLGDDRIINRLPKILGRNFYKSTPKRPIPVVLSAKREKVKGARAVKKAANEENFNAGTAKDIAAEIEKAIAATYVHLSPSTNTAVKVGYANFTPEQIAANIEAVVTALVERHIPNKWDNMKAIYIKGQSTSAVPIWETDELWLEGKDIVPNPPELAEKVEKTIEAPNVGKKRKSLSGPEDEKKKRPSKKPKPESNDDKLDKQIAGRKAMLAKQKAKAKAAIED